MKIEEPKDETIPKIMYDSMSLENKDLEDIEMDQINNINEEENKKSRTQRYHNSKKREEYDINIDNDNLEDLEQTIKTRHTKGRIEEDENEEINMNNNDINQDNKNEDMNKNNNDINQDNKNRRGNIKREAN